MKTIMSTVFCVLSFVTIAMGMPETSHSPKKDLSTTARYRKWKKEIKRVWKKQGIVSDLTQKEDLIGRLEPIFHFEKVPQQLRKNIVFAYIFLRSKFDSAPGQSNSLSSIKDLDKDHVEFLFAQTQKDQCDLINHISQTIKTDNGQEDKVDQEMTHIDEAISYYNILREIWHKPKVQTREKIDIEWLDSIWLDLDGCFWSMKPATSGHRVLLKHAQKKSGFKENIHFMEINNFVPGRSVWNAAMGVALDFPSGKHLLGLAEEPDLDKLFMTIYHELGHLIHKDTAIEVPLLMGLMNPRYYLKEKSVKKDLARLQTYVELGKTAFSCETTEGKIIKRLTAHYPELCSPPSEKKEAKKYQCYRLIEQRADLYAYEMLFKHHGTMSHIQTIAEFPWNKFKNNFSIEHNREKGHDSEIVASSMLGHPSHFEAVLTIAGFLKSKGIDVKKALDDYRNNGVCHDVEAYVASL